MPAQITIDQAGLPAGTPGVSRSDGLDTGALVTLTSSGGGATHLFEFLYLPLDDTTAAASLTPTSPTVWTFLPTSGVHETYRIRLTVDAGLSTEDREIRLFSIRTPNAGLRIPALNERANPDASLIDSGPGFVDDSEDNEPIPGGPYAAGNYGGWQATYRELYEYVEALVTGALPPTGPAGGDLGGSYPTPTVIAATLPGPLRLVWTAINAGELVARSGLQFVGLPSITAPQHGGQTDPTLHALATTAALGFTELATQAEVDAGIDSQRVITPATLAAAASLPPFLQSVIVVRTAADLPAPAAGVITLPAGTYIIDAAAPGYTLSLGTDTLVAQAGVFIVGTSQAQTIVTSSANPLFSYMSPDDPRFTSLREVVLVNVGGGAALYMDTGVGTFQTFLKLNDVTVSGKTELVNGQINFTDVLFAGTMEISGQITTFSVNRIATVSFPASPGLDIIAGGSVDLFTANTWLFFAAAPPDPTTIGIRVVTPGQVSSALISQASFFVGTPLSGLTVGADTWRFFLTSPIADSFAQGVSRWAGVGITVDLPVASAWTDVAAVGITYALDAAAQKMFLFSASTGEIEYNGTATATVKVGAAISHLRVGGTDVALELTVSKNGVPIPSSTESDVAINRIKTLQTLRVPIELSTGDRLRVQARDTGGAGTDIDVSSTSIAVSL